MKLVIQRVNYGRVTVDEHVIGQIGRGYVVLLGVGEGDTKAMCEKYVEKLVKLRIFPDENGKNKSLHYRCRGRNPCNLSVYFICRLP